MQSVPQLRINCTESAYNSVMSHFRINQRIGGWSDRTPERLVRELLAEEGLDFGLRPS